jgi:glucose-6-phosphate 1-dehydrogenase
MPVTATEVLVELKHPQQAVIDASPQGLSDYFRFRLSPDVSISPGARAKLPGEAMVGERVELVVRQAPADEMTPYERLLGDAIRGDPTLFVRS